MSDVSKGVELTKEDEFWLEQGKELLKGSIEAIESAGKQLITMLTTIQSIYLAVIAYSEFTKALDNTNIFKHIILVLPLIFWLIALGFAINIFMSKKYELFMNRPDRIKETFEQIAGYKQKRLTRTYVFIVIGFGVAMADIIIYFAIK